MIPNCPHCELKPEVGEGCPRVIRYGSFRRKSDSRVIQRFKCLRCERGFSRAIFSPCYRQNKRQKNEMVRRLLSSCVSQRRIAKILNLNRKTVVRKFIFLSEQARLKFDFDNSIKPLATTIEFDDLETFEHTKCKPLSVTLAVESPSRRILGFEVSKMPAKGKLAKISRKKYGPREDLRPLGRKKLFEKIAPLMAKDCIIKSDENPHYPNDVKRHFPESIHKAFKGKRGCIVGQGELKKVGFDPIFSLNHTCAMLRADINRLVRRTWCTTKLPERLADHIALYAHYHNAQLTI